MSVTPHGMSHSQVLCYLWPREILSKTHTWGSVGAGFLCREPVLSGLPSPGWCVSNEGRREGPSRTLRTRGGNLWGNKKRSGVTIAQLQESPSPMGAGVTEGLRFLEGHQLPPQSSSLGTLLISVPIPDIWGHKEFTERWFVSREALRPTSVFPRVINTALVPHSLREGEA